MLGFAEENRRAIPVTAEQGRLTVRPKSNELCILECVLQSSTALLGRRKNGSYGTLNSGLQVRRPVQM